MRSRPRQMPMGGLSQAGVLGSGESLEEVLEADQATVEELCPTHEQIAGRPEGVIEQGWVQWWISRPIAWPVTWLAYRLPMGVIDLFHSGNEHPFRWMAKLPVGVRHVIEIAKWRGFQSCPWSPHGGGPAAGETCSVGTQPPDSSMDVRITNLARLSSMRAPDLAVHLIREHGFYEGFEPRYRMDPEKLARVLGLRWINL